MMIQRLINSMTTIALAMTLGCHDPSLEIAREGAQRQAEQNKDMARVTAKAAAVTGQLVEEQGQSRQDLFAAQRDLHAQRSQLNTGWNDLESERQHIASSRLTDSVLAALVRGGGAVLAAILALGITWLALFGLSRGNDSTGLACELLVEELVCDAPRIESEMLNGSEQGLVPRDKAVARLPTSTA
jgi:hypothetical protein